jgi:hypothetical protein
MRTGNGEVIQIKPLPARVAPTDFAWEASRLSTILEKLFMLWTGRLVPLVPPPRPGLYQIEVDLCDVRAVFAYTTDTPLSPSKIGSASISPSPLETVGGKPRIYGDELTKEIKTILKTGKKSMPTVWGLIKKRFDCRWREFEDCWYDKVPKDLKLRQGEREPR